jgi:hypothetical protein
MNRKLFFYSIIWVLGPLLLRGQESFRLASQVEGSFADFTVDALNNVYLLDKNGQLKKRSANGDSMGVFNEVRKFGKLSSIDVSNPLKTLLFYRDFSTLVALDRFLGRRNTLDLRKMGLYQVKAVSLAYDNGYWVYDELEARVKHLGENGDLQDQFTDLRLLFDAVPAPVRIVDQNKYLYLYDPAKGFFIFDYYGSFRRKIPLVGWKDFTVINSLLYGYDETNIYRYDPANLSLQAYPIGQRFSGAQKIRVTSDFFYVLKAERLEVYRYQ